MTTLFTLCCIRQWNNGLDSWNKTWYPFTLHFLLLQYLQAFYIKSKFWYEFLDPDKRLILLRLIWKWSNYLLLRHNSYVLIYNLFNQGLLHKNWLRSQSILSWNPDRGHRDLCKTQPGPIRLSPLRLWVKIEYNFLIIIPTLCRVRRAAW